MNRFLLGVKRTVMFSALLALFLNSCASDNFVEEAVLVSEPLSRPAADAAYHYKITPQGPLELHVFYPAGYDPERSEAYPAALCFHGGGWVQGPIEWGYREAQFMAGQGFVGIAVEYRLANRRNVSALDCMKDANSAIRWLRLHSAELNVDPEKILAMGDSAGGHLAVSTAMFPQFREESEDSAISSLPQAVFCLAPALALNNDNYFQNLLLGQEWAVNCSPLDQVKEGICPIYIVQGNNDMTVPLRYTQSFAEKMRRKGNTVEVFVFPGGGHDFFHADFAGIAFWQKSLSEVVVELGWVR